MTDESIRIRLRLFEFAATHSLNELLQKTLDEVGELTQSPIGFYHFMESDQKTLTLQAWSTRTIKEFCTAEGKGMNYPIDKAGVWVDCVHQRKPVIHNDYASLPHRRGLPKGHAELVRELVVPIMRSGRIVALLGVGNKPTDYTEKDIIFVSLLADTAWGIAEIKKAEERIMTSLIEKEVLLKEIHHRVKNNLQIIASLLRMQTRHAGDKVEDGIFRESQDRIRAMAAVHSMLYKSESLAEINFGEYVRETAGHLFRSYNTNPKAVSLLIHAEDVMISINTAIPCGLIINELISNVLKHAFPDGRSGEIRVEMKKDENGIRIIFEDNGAGFPEGIDFHNTETLGLQLINMLVAQLDGAIEMDRNGGTRYVITLKP
jgi:two-component sensor histidine kinase